MILGEENLEAESINTQATVTLEQDDNGFTISAIHLDTLARIPGADQSTFETAANKAKEGCPVSKLFKANITLDAKLEN